MTPYLKQYFIKKANEINWQAFLHSILGLEGNGGGIRQTTAKDFINRYPEGFSAIQKNYTTNFPPKSLWPAPSVRNVPIQNSFVTNIGKFMLQDLKLPNQESSLPQLLKRYRGLNDSDYISRGTNLYNNFKNPSQWLTSIKRSQM